MKSLKRINLLISEEQYNKLSAQDLNLSGLVRDLLNDHFSEFKIILSVSEETKKIYDKVVSNTGGDDAQIEQILRKSLKSLLALKIEEMKNLQEKL